MGEGENSGMTDSVQTIPSENAEHNLRFVRPTPLPFGPGRPLLPVYPEEQPRIFEYAPGVNLAIMPRAGFGLVSFQTLRNLAVACKEIRLNIELIKREVRALDWEILSDKENLRDEEAKQIRQIFEQPDGYHDFDTFVSMMLEELLVTDALTLWVDFASEGQEAATIELVDGATIRPLLDERGRIPVPPMPAFLQVLHGMPTAWFARDRLIYRPFNARASTPYGMSPTEFVLLAVNLALRRDTYHVAYFTEGNVPEALIGAPSSWTQQEVEIWQSYWDALVTGNLTEQRKIHFMPLESGRSGIPVYEFRRDDPNQTAQDEWLMRVACWAFGNSPAEFGITPGQGLGGTGFVQGMENVQYRSMLGPITQYLENLFNTIIHDWLRCPDVRFIWKGMEPQEDKLQQAQVDQIYLMMGVYDANHVRERLGLSPTVGVTAPVLQGEAGPAGQSFFRRRRGDYP